MPHAHPYLRSIFVAIALLFLAPPTLAQTPAAAPTGRFLHLSDIHFDPFADPTLFSQLNTSSYDQWEAIFQSSGVTTPGTNTHQDTNYPLLRSTLDQAATGTTGTYDYVIYTGDYLAHEFVKTLGNFTTDPTEQKRFTANTISFVNMMIANHWPSAPLIATVGNNDSECGDYNLTPDGDILPALGADLPVIANDPIATRDFTAGGYYLTPHPIVANVDFVVLSIFWSRNYYDSCSRSAPDPAAAQLKWLGNVLENERKTGRKAILLMHIPPGIDGFNSYRHKGSPVSRLWTDDGADLKAFLALTSQYKAQLSSAYAGHTHMDEFRVLADTSPYLAIRMAPSVSTYNGNRPAFSVFSYDNKDASPLDYSVTAFDNANWIPEYSFSKSYGYTRYDPASLQALAGRIRTDAKTQQDFGTYYASGNATPAMRSSDLPYFACALTSLTVSTYNSCRQNMAKIARKQQRN